MNERIRWMLTVLLLTRALGRYAMQSDREDQAVVGLPVPV